MYCSTHGTKSNQPKNTPSATRIHERVDRDNWAAKSAQQDNATVSGNLYQPLAAAINSMRKSEQQTPPTPENPPQKKQQTTSESGMYSQKWVKGPVMAQRLGVGAGPEPLTTSGWNCSWWAGAVSSRNIGFGVTLRVSGRKPSPTDRPALVGLVILCPMKALVAPLGLMAPRCAEDGR